MSVGLAGVFIPASSTALIGVGHHDAGVASAVLNTSQQIGGSLGTALLNTLFAGAVTAYLADNPITDPAKAEAIGNSALIHGYHVAFFWGAVLLAAALVATLVVHQRPQGGRAAGARHGRRLTASRRTRRPAGHRPPAGALAAPVPRHDVPVTTRVAVAAPNGHATDAALRVVADGGGAVDAAVAAMLVTMVTEPGIVSLAGGAFATVWPAGEPAAVTVDGYVAMPGLGRPARAGASHDVVTDYGAGVTMTAGLGSVAVPGALAGARPGAGAVGPPALARGRRRPRRRWPATGFPLGAASGYYLPYVRDSLFGWDPQTRAALEGPDGRLARDRRPGGRRRAWPTPWRRWPPTGRPHVLHRRRSRRSSPHDMAARGGLVSAEDLAAYRPVVRPALAGATSAPGGCGPTRRPPSAGRCSRRC